MNVKKLLLPALLGAVFASQSQAMVIDFDAHPTDFGTPIIESGFQFDFTSAGWGVFGPGSGACCDVNYNGTTSLFADGDRDGQRAFVVMTKVGGGFSNLVSLTFQDSVSGAFLAAPGFGIDNVNTAPVPEPETYALMLLGLGALLGVRRLSQRADNA